MTGNYLMRNGACTVHRGRCTEGTRFPLNASGAGDRFALAGAKCERRLPARYGPAPEVPAHIDARFVETQWAAQPYRGVWIRFHPDQTEGYR